MMRISTRAIYDDKFSEKTLFALCYQIMVVLSVQIMVVQFSQVEKIILAMDVIQNTVHFPNRSVFAIPILNSFVFG